MATTYEPLEEILRNSGLRYKVIAERMGITYDALYRFRHYPNRLTLERIKELEKAIGVEEGTIYDLMKNFAY